MTDQKKPQPGASDAVEKGCVCFPADGEPNESKDWPGWVTDGCPLHEDSRDKAAVS